jgi:hypothetical protein
MDEYQRLGHTKTERDGGGIQAQQLVLEAEFVFAQTQDLLLAKARQSGLEEIFKQRRRPVLVGVGQRRTARRFQDAEMDQFAEAAGQTVADLAQRIGAAELAEQHRDELRPAGKTLGGPLGVVFLDQRPELVAGKMMEQLIEQTRGLYDCLALLWLRRSARLRVTKHRQRSIIGGHSPSTTLPARARDDQSCFGQECSEVMRI